MYNYDYTIVKIQIQVGQVIEWTFKWRKPLFSHLCLLPSLILDFDNTKLAELIQSLKKG